MSVEFARFLTPAFYNDHKFSIIVAGRQTGKTYGAVIWILSMLLANRSSSGLWIDTTHNNLKKYFNRYFIKILKKQGIKYHLNLQDKILTLPNGSYLDFASAERPENMEGQNYKFFVLNEAGIILKKEYLWYNTLLPMFKNATGKIIGTPKGKNVFFKLFSVGNDKLDPDYQSFHFSCYDSPFWNEDQLQKIKSKVPEHVWRQEYLAKFLDGTGTVFRNISEVLHKDVHNEPKSGTSYVMAADLAKHQDYTVITVGDLDNNKHVFVDRFNQIDWGMQKKRIINVYNRFNIQKLILDSSGVGDPIFDDLVNNGLNVEGFKFTNSSKNNIISGLSVAIDNKEIQILDDETLVSELESFELQVSPTTGVIKYNAPEGLHDDCVISLALLNYGMQNYSDVHFTMIEF